MMLDTSTFKIDQRNQKVREVLSRLKNILIGASIQPSELKELLQNLQTIDACFEADWEHARSLKLQVNELREAVLSREAMIAQLKKNYELLENDLAESQSTLNFLIKGTSKTVLKPLLDSYKQLRLMVCNEYKDPSSNEFLRKEEEIQQSGFKDIKIYFGGKLTAVRYCGKLENGKPVDLGKLIVGNKIIVANFQEVYTEDEPIWKTRADPTGNNNATIYYQNGDIYIGTVRCSKNFFSRDKGTLQVLGENSKLATLKGEWNHQDQLKQPKPDQLQAHAWTV